MASALALPDTILASPILSALLPLTVGNIIGFISRPRSTYKQLRQPPLAPPGWVFGPVWTALYVCMGVASHLAFKAGGSRSPLYTVQLLLNFAWMPLFFGKSLTRVALVDCAALTGCIGLLMHQWWRLDRRAAYLLAPYLCWTGFATYLTEEVGRRNNWDVITPAKERKDS